MVASTCVWMLYKMVTAWMMRYSTPYIIVIMLLATLQTLPGVLCVKFSWY